MLVIRMKTLLLLFLATAVVLNAQSIGETAVIGDKSVTADVIERMVRDHVAKINVVFDFDHSTRTFFAAGKPASVYAAHLMFHQTNGTRRNLTAWVARDGQISVSVSPAAMGGHDLIGPRR
jgi:hypothetical protein